MIFHHIFHSFFLIMNLTVGHNNCYINVIYFLFPSDSEIVVAGGKSVWDSWDWITVEKYNVHTGDPLTLIRVSCQSIPKEGLVGLLLIPTDVGLFIPTPQCPSFGTVLRDLSFLRKKLPDFESSVKVKFLRD